MPDALDTLLNLASALAVGLLIGAERGWQQRDLEDGRFSAGIRTFALCGLLGGLAELLGEHLGVIAWASIFAGFCALVIAAYFGELRRHGDMGMTSEVALLTTFLLGSLAVAGHPQLAAAGAVAVALLLSLKQVLHGSLHRLSELELSGALKLLFISLVLLPALPNQSYGPWQVFNPYVTWWMVVLIAGMGFVAYMAIRLAGTRQGLLITALLGGVVSSTAMTITLARLDRARELRAIIACGLLATSALMFPRVLLEVSLVNAQLLPQLLWPLSAAMLVYAGGALAYALQGNPAPTENAEPPLKNPFELGPALRFAALLVAILFVVEGARRWFGDAGVYLVALLSGLADVDAITLSLARSARSELDAEVAVRGIFLATLSNSLAKGLLIALIGGRELALRTLPVMAAGLCAGLLILLLI
ncbi:MgtC/SapB family protein [Pseudomonas sp. LPB0260]|uniref:MgtC/SapB family protein n=1 Tax=Pseudomonas sp. LPB0260 TaxID=2614442 RepID=UPI0015C280B3|nr:MgtC/SapB family protein [Pseudomonas sp. LPB0260]QLC74327.1 MgtC/SapB family protein [Pseudomonas sp. LPB0260]QLC77097.1 MgtC/SapB family protein [Pseudomonas sp. LPB0260]